MQESLDSLVSEVREQIDTVQSLPDFEQYKARIVGPKGQLTLISRGIGKLPKEERPGAGKLIQEAKSAVESLLNTRKEALDAEALMAELGEAIDPSLPSPDKPMGAIHPLTQVRREVNDIFRRLGFTVAEGPELETEWFCFDALNTPEDHPARDEADTLYFPKDLKVSNVSRKADERYILRTHTSTVQIRTLLKEKPPLRIVSPGRAFRRDTVDATHSANFHQVEGLYVDRNVTVKDLKAALDNFVHEFFGSDVETRLRPSFFPFTEPSFELDFRSPNVGKLSNQWIEIMGCGLVDPEVLTNCGLDAQEWKGFAFGMGIERLAMLRFGIDDIRYFYQNDLRFLRQFK